MKKYFFMSFIGVLLFASTSFADAYVRRPIYCESNSQKFKTCETGLWRIERLMLDRQRSNSPCVEGQSYRIDNRTRVAVYNGCRAWFSAEGWTSTVRRDDVVLREDRPGFYDEERIRCESIDRRTETCYTRNLRSVNRVTLVRQLSNTNCIPNQTFFALRNGVQVTGGCRGDFLLRGQSW